MISESHPVGQAASVSWEVTNALPPLRPSPWRGILVMGAQPQRALEAPGVVLFRYKTLLV